MNSQSKKPESKHWSNTEERGSSFGIMFLYHAFKIFGATACKVIMLPVLLYFYLFNGVARGNVTFFLKQQAKYFGHKPFKRRHVFKVFINFGFGVIDRLSAWQGRFDKLKLHKSNNQIFLDMREKQQGGVIIISHLGNFEISRIASAENKGAKFNIFMHTKNAKKITQALEKINPGYGASLIQGDGLNMKTAILLKEKVEQGEFVVIAGDRTPVANEAAITSVTFLGETVNLPIGPYVLAKVLDCPVLTLFCTHTKAGYHVQFSQLAERIAFNKSSRDVVIQQHAQKYANQLELMAKSSPLQWYNFHDFWKKGKA